MRKKCNAIGQERTVNSETAPTWRKGAVTCQGKIAALNTQRLKKSFPKASLNYSYDLNRTLNMSHLPPTQKKKKKSDLLP